MRLVVVSPETLEIGSLQLRDELSFLHTQKYVFRRRCFEYAAGARVPNSMALEARKLTEKIGENKWNFSHVDALVKLFSDTLRYEFFPVHILSADKDEKTYLK